MPNDISLSLCRTQCVFIDFKLWQRQRQLNWIWSATNYPKRNLLDGSGLEDIFLHQRIRRDIRKQQCRWKIAKPLPCGFGSGTAIWCNECICSSLDISHIAYLRNSTVFDQNLWISIQTKMSIPIIRCATQTALAVSECAWVDIKMIKTKKTKPQRMAPQQRKKMALQWQRQHTHWPFICQKKSSDHMIQCGNRTVLTTISVTQQQHRRRRQRKSPFNSIFRQSSMQFMVVNGP